MTPPECNVFVQLATEVKRLDELREKDFHEIIDKLKDHVDYTKQRFDSEMKRLSEVRDTDVKNVSTASAAATETAQVLAKQVIESAENLRTLVATAAEAAAKRQEAFANQIEGRLRTLDISASEVKGRSGISVPLVILVATLAGGMIVFLIQRMWN